MGYAKLQLIVNGLIIGIVGSGRRAAVKLGRNGVSDVLNLLEFLFQIVSRGRLTFRVDPLGGLLDGVQERLLVIRVQLATETVRVTELGLEAVDVGREGVEGFDALLLGFVIGSELLSLSNHAVNLLLSETSLLVGDGDRLGFTSTLVSGGDLHDTVGVDLERNLDLGNTTRSGGDASELELAKKVVVLGEGTFSLKYLDQDGGLVIGGGGEDLALASGDGGTTGNKLGHNTTGGLDAKSEGADVDEEDVTQCVVATEDTTLDGSTIGNSLIGVDTLGRLLSEVLLEELLDLGDAGGTTDENDLQGVSAGLSMTETQENLPRRYPPS
jgi:hypothetical protein